MFHGFLEAFLLQKWLMTMSAIMTRHMGSNSRLLLKITDHVVEYAEAYWHRRPNDRLYSQASASQEQALAWYKDLCVAPIMLGTHIHIENIYRLKGDNYKVSWSVVVRQQIYLKTTNSYNWTVRESMTLYQTFRQPADKHTPLDH